MQFFTPITILIATSAGFLFGTIWYSPWIFLNAWLIGNKITKAELPKRSKIYNTQIAMYSLVTHGCIAAVLALLFDIAQVATLKVAVSLGLLITFGFIVTTQFMDMIYTTEGVHYDKPTQIKFLVSSGYYLGLVIVMSVTLFFFVAR